MFFPANVKAKALSQRAEFGPISCITVRYPQLLPPYEDRASNDKMINFLDHFVHPHSLLKFLGGPIESLFVARSPIGSATVTFQFKSGAIGNLLYSVGQSASSFYERTEIIGDGENIVIDNNIRVTFYRKAPPVGYGRSGDYFELFDDATAPLQWEPEFSLGQLHNKGLFLLGYAQEIIHFTTRLLDGKGPEWGTLDDALELMLIYEAYRKSDGAVHFIGK